MESIQEEFYRDYYPSIESDTTASRYHSLTHRLLERTIFPTENIDSVLEVGAGEGQHFPFVLHEFRSYVMLDVRKPPGLEWESRVTFREGSVESIPFADDSFDRVIATCLLHHLNDPMTALREMRRVASKNGGIVSIMMACDPGMTYRAAHRLTSGRRLDKMGLHQWKLVHALEHRNHIASLDQMLRYVFQNDSIHATGFPLPSARFWNLNLLNVYQIRIV